MEHLPRHVLRESPLARWHHRNRYITEQMIQNLFELPAAIEAQRRQERIFERQREFLLFLKRRKRP